MLSKENKMGGPLLLSALGTPNQMISVLTYLTCAALVLAVSIAVIVSRPKSVSGRSL